MGSGAESIARLWQEYRGPGIQAHILVHFLEPTPFALTVAAAEVGSIFWPRKRSQKGPPNRGQPSACRRTPHAMSDETSASSGHGPPQSEPSARSQSAMSHHRPTVALEAAETSPRRRNGTLPWKNGSARGQAQSRSRSPHTAPTQPPRPSPFPAEQSWQRELSNAGVAIRLLCAAARLRVPLDAYATFSQSLAEWAPRMASQLTRGFEEAIQLPDEAGQSASTPTSPPVLVHQAVQYRLDPRNNTGLMWTEGRDASQFRGLGGADALPAGIDNADPTIDWDYYFYYRASENHWLLYEDDVQRQLRELLSYGGGLLRIYAPNQRFYMIFLMHAMCGQLGMYRDAPRWRRILVMLHDPNFQHSCVADEW